MPAIWIELAKFKFTFFEHVSLRDVSYEQTLHSAFLKIKLPALKHTIKKELKNAKCLFLTTTSTTNTTTITTAYKYNLSLP